MSLTPTLPKDNRHLLSKHTHAVYVLVRLRACVCECACVYMCVLVSQARTRKSKICSARRLACFLSLSPTLCYSFVCNKYADGDI